MRKSFSLHNILIADYMPLSLKWFFSKPYILPTVMLSKFHNPYFPINIICVANCNSLDLWFFLTYGLRTPGHCRVYSKIPLIEMVSQNVLFLQTTLHFLGCHRRCETYICVCCEE